MSVITTAPPRTRRMTLRRRRQFAGFLFALPAIALVIGFIGIPIGQAVYYSFTNWDGLTAQWIGWSTWSQAFQSQPVDGAREQRKAAVGRALRPRHTAVHCGTAPPTCRRVENLPLHLLSSDRHLLGGPRSRRGK